MKISRISSGEWGKVRAYFDLTTSEGITIKGFRLIMGIKGLFVGNPSEKDESGTYKDTVWMDKPVKDKITELAISAHENGIDIPIDDEPPF